jgi:hypothetical protein
MEIRCDHCGETDAPADVTQAGDKGMVVRCQHCGETSILETSGSATQAESSETSSKGEDLGELELDEVMPEPGAGSRCPKCAALLEDRQMCPNCGLDQSLVGDGDGIPPWIDASTIPEAEQKEARRLWEAYTDSGDDEKLTEFVQFSKRIGLEEFAIRKLRFWLGHNPDDDNAKQQLGKLLDSFKKQLWGANKALKAERQDFQREVSDYREKFLMFAVVFWSLVAVLIIYFGV